MKTRSKGFTLIELLMVIAIIAILVTIVLIALSDARNKGRDGSAKAELNQLRNAADLYSTSNGNVYGSQNGNTALNMCGQPGGQVPVMLAAISTNANHAAVCTVGMYTSYEAHVTLNNNSTFCVDSSGFSGVISGTPTAGTDLQTAKCQ